jgi:hypothetical protein
MKTFTAFFLAPVYEMVNEIGSLTGKPITVEYKVTGQTLDTSLQFLYMEFIESIGNRIPLYEEYQEWLSNNTK